MVKHVTAIQALIEKYKKMEQTIPQDRMMEKLACELYIGVFKKCLGKAKRGKHEKFMFDEFGVLDRRRLDLSGDFPEEACMEALKQEAYRQAWEACEFDGKRLVKQKQRMYIAGGPTLAFYGDNGKKLYTGITTGRTSMGAK